MKTTDLASPITEITDEYMQETLARRRPPRCFCSDAHRSWPSRGSRAIVWEHGRRNMALRAQGTLPIVCPVGDDSEWAGIGIFDAGPRT